MLATAKKYTYKTFLICCFVLLSKNAIAIQPSFIKGTVYNAYNGSIITSATIQTNTGLSTTTTTGSFYLRVPPNVYDIIVSSSGYRSNVLTGIFALPGQTSTVNIRLSPSPGKSAYISGNIFMCSTGVAIEGAYVATDIGSITTTNENGYFKIMSPPGTATITIAAEGYQLRTIRNTELLSNHTNNINTCLIKSPSVTVSVSGKIINACTGATIKDARIISLAGDISTNSNGSYSVNQSSGPACLIASASGYQYVLADTDLHPLLNETYKDIELFPSENGYIKGSIINALTEEPIEGARIETDTETITFSTHNGKYDLYTSLCTYELTASREGFAELKIPISVTQGLPITLNLALEPLASISGTILSGTDNHTIGNATILLMGHTVISTTSNKNGFYSFNNIPLSQYELSVSHDCFATNNHHVLVSSSETLELNFLLEPYATGRIQGFIYDMITSQPLAGASILTDGAQEAITDSNGFYSLIVPACSTPLMISANGYLSKTSDLYIDDNDVLDFNCHLIPCPLSLSASTEAIANAIGFSLEPFRLYRDEVAVKNISIKRYVHQFYENSLIISQTLLENQNLREKLSRLILMGFKTLENRLPGNTIIIEKEYLEEIYCFLEQFGSATSSSDVKNITNSLLIDLNNEIILNNLKIKLK